MSKEYKVFKSSVEYPNKVLQIISAARGYLISNVVTSEQLSNIPWVVVVPSKSSSWIEGVILIGHTDITIEGNQNGTIFFHTPEDRDNSHDGHFINISKESPIIKNISSGIGPLLKVGISDNYGQGEFDINEYHHLIIPKGLRENKKPNQNYSPKAIFIAIERKTYKNTPLSFFNSRATLLATALNPLK